MFGRIGFMQGAAIALCYPWAMLSRLRPLVFLCSAASVATGCALHRTHHKVVFRDPAAVSVLIHPPGPGRAELSLPVGQRGLGEAVSYTDRHEEHPRWNLRAVRLADDALQLEFRAGESLLSSVALVDRGGLLDGGARVDDGLFTDGTRVVVRDPDGLVWTRAVYMPTAPSKRQEREPDWQRIASHIEAAGPGAVSLVTTPENIRTITRRTEVPWETPALLLTLGAVMIAASVVLFAEMVQEDVSAGDRRIATAVGTFAAAGGVLGVVVGTSGFLARGAETELDPAKLPVQEPRRRPPSD